MSTCTTCRTHVCGGCILGHCASLAAIGHPLHESSSRAVEYTSRASNTALIRVVTAPDVLLPALGLLPPPASSDRPDINALLNEQRPPASVSAREVKQVDESERKRGRGRGRGRGREGRVSASSSRDQDEEDHVDEEQEVKQSGRFGRAVRAPARSPAPALARHQSSQSAQMLSSGDHRWPEQFEGPFPERRFNCPVCVATSFPTEISSKASFANHINDRHASQGRVLSPKNEESFALTWCDVCEDYFQSVHQTCPECS